MSGCDHEQVALYVSRDLDQAAASGVEEHLRGCSACRELAEALQADAGGLKRLLTATEGASVVARAATPRRFSWVPVAAAAVLVALTVGVVSQPTMAAGLRQAFQWLTVQRLDPQQMATYLDDLNQRSAPADQQQVPVQPLLVTTDVQAAEKSAGFAFLKPAYLPPGYSLKQVWVWPGALADPAQRSMQQVYAGGHSGTILTIAHALIPETAGTVSAPAEKTAEVAVGDGKGLVVYGAISQAADGSPEWTEGPVTLRFYHDGEAVRITATTQALTVRELVRIAESIP